MSQFAKKATKPARESRRGLRGSDREEQDPHRHQGEQSDQHHLGGRECRAYPSLGDGVEIVSSLDLDATDPALGHGGRRRRGRPP